MALNAAREQKFVKAIGKEQLVSPEDAYGEFVGLAKLDRSALAKAFVQKPIRGTEQSEQMMGLASFFQLMINSGTPLGAEAVYGNYREVLSLLKS